MKKEYEKRNSSKVLGILSICLFWTGFPGVVLGIIGLSIKKDEENRNRDITLGVIGLIASLFMCYIYGITSGIY